MATCRFIYFAHEYSSALIEKLNAIDYLGYIFMYPNIIVGVIPYTDYYNFIHLKGHYKNNNLKNS